MSISKPKRTILIVDDTPGSLHLLSYMLSEQGYHVCSQTSGRAALASLRAEPPDLMLLDINMPEMDGYEVCRALKADSRTADIPVLFISAANETWDKVKAFSVGGVDYITKPFQLEEVLARVETHLSLCDLRQQLQQANEILEQRVYQRTMELTQLYKACERFVPNELLTFLGRTSILDATLGDYVKRDMTIFFSDIRAFTNISEQMTAEESFIFINDYFRLVNPIIQSHGGLIIKYTGDGVMALFPDNPEDAITAAVTMLHQFHPQNLTLEQLKMSTLQLGIGIHYGAVMVGLIGDENRAQGDAYSDNVNLTARIEGLTKRYGVSLLVSEEALSQLQQPHPFHVRPIGMTSVRGKSDPVSLFEVFDGDDESLRSLKLNTLEAFERGMRRYREARYAEACVDFSKVLERNPSDKTAQLYLQKAAKLMVDKHATG